MSLNHLVSDGRRQMQICNACRYCEGYCAVWKAIEWRREFTEKDMTYLANLCHDCRDCYFACPFAPPHEFGINPPKLFAGLREESYQKYAWPSSWAQGIANKVQSFWFAAIIGFLVALTYMSFTAGSHGLWHEHSGHGAFYQLISELVLEVAFGILGLWLVAGWIIGAVRFWKDIKTSASQPVKARDVRTALSYGAKLRYLGSKGQDEELAGNRKWLHHFVFYGFSLDFLSTTLGAFYSHVLHIQAPYPIYNPVVVLGIIGGIGIMVGASGLLYVKTRSKHAASDEGARKSGNAFSLSLLVVATTGMLVLLFRNTPALGTILAVHLGSVAALFFTAPYTKFAHFIYRFLALVRYAQEERDANQ